MSIRSAVVFQELHSRRVGKRAGALDGSSGASRGFPIGVRRGFPRGVRRGFPRGVRWGFPRGVRRGFPRGVRWGLAPALMTAGVAACAPARPPEPATVRPGWSETGIASWYGPGFHGRPTASGEIYDMEALTAAHPWLPFQTLVRVRNLDNRRTAVVRINDRGPFARGRILDLSRAAARKLGMLGPGTAKVRVTVLELSEQPPPCSELQLGAFREPENLRAALARVRRAGLEPRVEPGPEGLSRVIAGPFEEPGEARRARDRLGGILRPCRATPAW